jgi:hypothetical protein
MRGQQGSSQMPIHQRTPRRSDRAFGFGPELVAQTKGYRTPPMGETGLPLLDRSGTPPSSRLQALDYAGGDVDGTCLTETHSR